jgi:prepilin-type N-terminal cleavage/methylation domain-containing protein
VERSKAIWGSRHFEAARAVCGGFTLIELLVVVAITSLVAAVVLPGFSKVRREAGLVKCMRNVREITCGVNIFAIDNNGRYPASVATIGFGGRWHWEDPRMLTGYNIRSPGMHRAMSEYLRDYIGDARVMFCPNAPRKYKCLQAAWDAGDDWSLPGTPMPDPVYGTYCFYWNYVGYLERPDGPFRGPWGPSCSRKYSSLLVTDYLGYDHWRSPESFGSSERFKQANVTEGTSVSSAYWSVPNPDGSVCPDSLEIKLHAGYADGRVEIFSPSEVVPMWVSTTAQGNEPDTIGPGMFYLPSGALH